MTGLEAIINKEYGMGREGVTLVELLVVITIIGILVLLGSRYIGDVVSKQRLNAAATGLGARLRQAKVIAITRNVPVTIRFNAASDSYLAFFDTDFDGTLDAGEGTINLDTGREAAISLANTVMPFKVDMYYAVFNATSPAHVTLVPPSGLPLTSRLPAGDTGRVCLKADIGKPSDTFADRYDFMRITMSSVVGRVGIWKSKPGQTADPGCKDETKWEKFL